MSNPPHQASPPVPPAFPAASAPLPAALPAMNAAAANASPADCQPKSWFAVSIYKVEKNKETYVEGVTFKLQIPDLGQIDKVTSSAVAPPIRIDQLNPGGTGDVLQMQHDTDVYEALGDFQ